jgi:hypothetical protein
MEELYASMYLFIYVSSDPHIQRLCLVRGLELEVIDVI